MQTSLDVASTYADAGQDSDALSEFQHAASLLASVGWQETHVSVTLFNNWALELDQIGRPLEAEKIERHVLEIARDDNTTEAVTPMVLNNYAKFLRQLARLDEAADYGQRAYAEAEKVQNQLVIGQSLLERARIAAAQHNTSQASALLSELEPLMRKKTASRALRFCEPLRGAGHSGSR